MTMIAVGLAVLGLALAYMLHEEIRHSTGLRRRVRALELEQTADHISWSNQSAAYERTVEHYQTLAANRQRRIDVLEKQLAVLPVRGSHGRFAPRIVS